MFAAVDYVDWRVVKFFDVILVAKASEAEKAEVEVDREQLLNELRENKKEQEDLLVLLADQDTKLKAYRKKLKELGEKVFQLLDNIVWHEW